MIRSRSSLHSFQVTGGLLLLGVLLSAAPSQAQTWQAHTSMRQVNALAASPTAVWAATSGGVFSYTPTDGALSVLTAAEGLHGVAAQSIAYDAAREVVWIGYADGALDRLDPTTGTLRTLRDIERATQFPDRAVNRLRTLGDTLLVATSFGLVVFDPVANEVRDSYTQFGTLAAGLPVWDMRVAPGPDGAPTLWLATNEGVAHAPLDAPNLKDPQSWTVEQQGLPDPAVRALAVYQGRVYVGTERDLAARQANGTYLPFGVTTFGITDLVAHDGRLIGAERFRLLQVRPDGTAGLSSLDGYENPAAVLDLDGQLYFGDQQGGLVTAAVGALNVPATIGFDVAPSGPFHGTFSDLTVDAQGTLWAGNDEGGTTGFYALDAEGRWTDYTPGAIEALAGLTGFYRVHADGAGNLWAASEGDGLVRIAPDGAVSIFNEDTSTLGSAAGAPGFIIVGGVSSDRQNRIWVTNKGSDESLHTWTEADGWAAVPLSGCSALPISVTFENILVDAFDQKWITVADRGSLSSIVGLLVLDTGADPLSPTDDACRYFRQPGGGGQGLPSTFVNTLAEDREGFVWMGTEDGMAYLINNGVTARDPNALLIWPQKAVQDGGSPFILDGLVINDIAPDPANRLWVATNEGAYLIRPEGSAFALETLFTIENSPIFSDVIVAITVDPFTGRVYFATDQGLVSYQGDAVSSSPEVRDLFVYPNPVRLQEGTEARVCIEGLVEETDLRILTANGALVRRLAGRGGSVCWDARDSQQQLVPSGMYLIVADGQNGEGAAYGKVAVIY
ncbi:MAG: two-component regulator propeller domain-containing protein [Bacteroidota bacterium]